MYPILFQIGSFRVDTYSVMWLIALSVAILWSLRRLELYKVDEWEARRVISWSFVAMLFGARVPEYIKNIKTYIASPSLFFDLNRGSLSEVGAITGAFGAAFLLCLFSKKISFAKLCDVAAPPAMLAIAIGRWGCFFNGCCVGLASKFFLAVHFPRDAAGVTRHPVQLYYSFCAAVIVLILLWAEKKTFRPRNIENREYHAVIAPLALILYSLMRFAVAFVRVSVPLSVWPNILTYRIILLAMPFECIWLIYSLRKIAVDNKY